MKQISTAKLGGRKKVEIDGHPYTVRKMGAGESLALSQTQRRIKELSKKDESKLTEEESAELERIGSKFIDSVAALYDDGQGGTIAKAMVASLSPDEIKAMNSAIWEEDEAPTPPTNA